MVKLLCLVGVTICIQNVVSVVNIEEEKKEKIDSFINSLLFQCDDHRNVVGMNLAVVHEGDVLYTTGYGKRNLDKNEPVTENSIYALASVSKQFVTTQLGQKLKDRGYTWDVKVRDIMSDLGTDFYFYDPLRSNQTNLRDLASHSAGISRNDYLFITQDMSRSETVSRLRFIEGVEEPRTTFRYTNLVYVLLGYVAELLGGTSWEELIRTEIYDKLGMTNSSFIYSVDESMELATPYMPYITGLREVSWQSFSDYGLDFGPAVGVTSTANDMAKWMNMLLSGGLNSAGERVLDADVISELQSAVNAYSTGTHYYPPEYPVSYSHYESYGLAFGPGSYRGYRTVSHTGSHWGMYTHLILFPDIELGIYLTINGLEGTSPKAKEHILQYVADIVLDQDPWLNETTACDFPFPTSKPIYEESSGEISLNDKHGKPLVGKRVEEYFGRYGNFAYNNVTVAADDVTGELILVWDAYSCTALNISGNFVGQGRGDFWYITIRRILFDEAHKPSQYVDLTFDEEEGPVRFERELSIEEAPGPTDHWPQCEELA